MPKRIVGFFSVFMLTMFLSVLILYRISNGTELAQTAKSQSNYKLTVASTRGTIYDCNLSAFTGAENEYVAAVVPGIETSAALSRILPTSKMEQVYDILSEGHPFTLTLPSNIQQTGIDVFTIQKRYSDSGLGVHILGYLDGTGKGAAGIEKAFDSVLSSNQGRITVTYKVDALNRVLAGEEKTISDTTDLGKSGVVLTLDKYIQTVAEQAADKYLTKGAIVVLEVPSGKIRAMVSRPAYNQNDVASIWMLRILRCSTEQCRLTVWDPSLNWQQRQPLLNTEFHRIINTLVPAELMWMGMCFIVITLKVMESRTWNKRLQTLVTHILSI
jgi:penicillin-binding protein 2